MNSEHHTPETSSTSWQVTPEKKPRYLLLSVMIGGMVAIPAGWLLAFLSALPFFLGVFFFMLLGLIIGATMYRFGRRSAPAARLPLWLMGVSVGLLTWGISIWVEYQTLPDMAFTQVRDTIKTRLTPEQRDQLEGAIAACVRKHLEEDYPPGGLWGYLQWAAADGSMRCPIPMTADTQEVRLPQSGTFWIIRNILSVLLVMWAILSQVLTLRTVPEQKPTLSADEELSGPAAEKNGKKPENRPPGD